MLNEMHPRFLLLRGGAIGDFIATLPILQALRTQWPNAHIEIWGYPHIANLAIVAGLAQQVTSLDRAEMARFFVPEPSFTDSQVATIRSFDIVFNYLHDLVGQVRSNLLLAGAKQVISGSPIIKRGHATDFLLEPLQALAIYDAVAIPTLDWPEQNRAAGQARLDALGLKTAPIAIHPGSGSPTKNWPIENYTQLVRNLRAEHREVVAIFGEADTALSAHFARELPEIPTLQNLTLVELADTLTACSSYLGNDSGISHLAAALGLPATILFGSSAPETWAPRGPAKIQILHAPNLDHPTEKVLHAIHAINLQNQHPS